MEQPPALWNASKALRGRGTPAGLFCIVRWQDGINPYIISVLLSSGTPSGLWNRAFGSIWNARRELVKNHYYTRDTHGSWRLCGAIVVLLWRKVFFSGSPESDARMGKGGDAERYKSQTRDETFVSYALSDDFMNSSDS